MKSYVTQPTNAEWTTWATPVPLALPNYNTNEFFCWKEGGIYHGVYVDFQYGGAWKHVTSTDILGTWSADQLLGFNSKEGGMILKKPAGGYRFYIEYGNGAATTGFRYSDCSDAFSAFAPETAVVSDTPMRNGKMILLPGATDFTAWATANTPASPAPLDDPDKDGIPNMLEALLGQNPTAPQMAPQPALTLGGQLALKYKRTLRFAGLTVEPETATALGAFAPAAAISRTMMTDGTELIETRLPAGSSGFLRLKAVQSP